MKDRVSIDLKDGVADVPLIRADNMNALDNAMFEGIIEAGDKLRARIPTRRFGKLDELDGPLLLLASDAGRHMTGAVLAVDGGHLVSGL